MTPLHGGKRYVAEIFAETIEDKPPVPPGRRGEAREIDRSEIGRDGRRDGTRFAAIHAYFKPRRSLARKRSLIGLHEFG